MKADPVSGYANSPLTNDNLRAAQRVLNNKHAAELNTNKYWTELMTVSRDRIRRRVPQIT